MIEQEFLALRRQVIEREFARMNERQLEAVTTTEGPLLVLAGAGSGKTTVLVNRIANLVKYGQAYTSDDICRPIDERDVQLVRDYLDGKVELTFDLQDLLAVRPARPWQILAITFTNKAANELKERLNAFLGDEALDIWAGTFHSVCSRILRRYGDRLGYSNHFTIYDTDDSRRVMKECQRLLNIDDKIMPHKEILSAIGHAKERLLTPAEYQKETAGDIRTSKYAECYALYQKLLMQADAMDFDDMIFNAVKLLEQDDEVRDHYQHQFRYVLVDEYQDTDPAQYVLTSILAGKYRNICVVGDDDQSIYGFRGATIENILGFEGNYKNAKTIRLEQNYRSTGNILNAANEVISHNTQRKGKNLWTDAGDGEKITLFTAANADYEGRYIADVIQTNVSQGRKFSDHAILYRSNAQSGSIESVFIKNGIPYKIIGGRRFYERKEIRDAIAYLTVVDNPADNVKLRRIINEPKRGIGDTTVNAAADIAAGLGVSVYEVISHADEYARLSRSATKLKKFTNLIDSFRTGLEDADMGALFEELMEQSGYLDSLKADKERFQERRENLDELKNNIVRYMQENPDGDLSGFLEEVSLLTDIDQYNEQLDSVVLMTMHAAKGLEFPIVFLAGMEEGIFPSRQSMFDSAQMQEERRLAYVGITRAKEKLYLTNAAERLLYGSTSRNRPSPFLEELPPDVSVEENDHSPYSAEINRGFSSYGDRGFGKGYGADFGSGYTSFGHSPKTSDAAHKLGVGKAARKKAPAAPTGETFAPGDTVRHRAFGTGVVLNAKPMGNDTLLEIAFEKAGTKKVMANFAKLTKV
ncbi:MAG: UvrD-helicase domain-containing protein [Clostridia bacterium]|nr:UvrD-helicase domain-containing protein [Clostridia bacterium]